MRTFIALAFLFATTAHAATESYPIDMRHSTIAFSIGIAGGLTTVEGTFDKWSGEILYDPAAAAQSSVTSPSMRRASTPVWRAATTICATPTSST